jgi:hypothetical protein
MKQVLALIALSTALAASASAAAITYNASGVLNCNGSLGCTQVNAQVIQFGGLQIQFFGIASSTVNAMPFTFGSFGDLFSTCIDGTITCGQAAVPSGVTLVVQIGQTAPAPGGTGNIPAGGVTGTISGSGSTAFVLWPTNNQIQIVTPSNVTSYSIANNPLSLVPPANNNCGQARPNCGDTTIQGRIDSASTSTPEPGSIALLGSGILALVLRRRQQ